MSKLVKVVARRQSVVTKPRVRVRKPLPWSSYVDSRAIVAIVAHLHCGTSHKRRYVTVDQIAKFILKDSLTKLSKARREDVREAFEKVQHRELVEMLSFLVQYLNREGVLIADSGVVSDFRICRDELRVLDGVHQTMYPKLKIVFAQTTLLLVHKVG